MTKHSRVLGVFFIFFLLIPLAIAAPDGTGTITTNGTNVSGAQSNVTVVDTNNTYSVTAWNVGNGIKTFTIHVFNTTDTLTFNLYNNTPGMIYELRVNGTAKQGYQADSLGLVTFRYVQPNGNRSYDLRPATVVGGQNFTWSWFKDIIIKNGTIENVWMTNVTQVNVNITTLNATEITGNGSRISGINGTNITFGEIPEGRISGSFLKKADGLATNLSILNPFYIDSRNVTVNDTGLVLDMRFDENSTGTANSTKIYDSSKSANDGAWYGHTRPNWTSGKYGSGLLFDGVNDYVDVGNAIQPDYFTIGAWVMTAELPFSPWAFIASNNDGIDNSFELQGFEDQSYLRLVVATTGSDNIISSAIQKDTWVYVVATFDGTTMKIYLNGKLDNSKVHGTPGAIIKSGNPLYIGWRPAKDHASWNGTIDEVRIYNRTLSADEVRALYYSNPLNEKSSFVQTNNFRVVNSTGNTTFNASTQQTTVFSSIVPSENATLNIGASDKVFNQIWATIFTGDNTIVRDSNSSIILKQKVDSCTGASQAVGWNGTGFDCRTISSNMSYYTSNETKFYNASSFTNTSLVPVILKSFKLTNAGISDSNISLRYWFWHDGGLANSMAVTFVRTTSSSQNLSEAETCKGIECQNLFYPMNATVNAVKAGDRIEIWGYRTSNAHIGIKEVYLSYTEINETTGTYNS